MGKSRPRIMKITYSVTVGLALYSDGVREQEAISDLKVQNEIMAY